MIRPVIFTLFFVASIGIQLPLNSRDVAEAGFYDGKTIKIIEGRRPGGTGSFRVQVTVKHLKKYLGFSAAVFQYVPGAGGTAGVNHVVNSARRDGLTLGNSSSGMFARFLLGARGVRYDIDDLLILGAGSPGGVLALTVRPGLKIRTVEELRAGKRFRFGNRSVGHSLYNADRVAAYVIGIKDPRWILGYSSSEVHLAMERGEMDMYMAGIAGLVRDVPQWTTSGYTFVAQLKDIIGQGVEDYPTITQGIPTLTELADTKLKKDIIRMHNAATPGGSIFYVHKGVPSEARKELTVAFNKVWNDPEFLKDYEKFTNQKATPVTGAQYTKIIEGRPRDPKVLKLYKELTGGGRLPTTK